MGQVATPIKDLGSDLSLIEVESGSLCVMQPLAVNSLPPLGDGRGLTSDSGAESVIRYAAIPYHPCWKIYSTIEMIYSLQSLTTFINSHPVRVRIIL